ncbi:hypothetical protein HY411_03120 [Candidatus Gottesmanbacteria bacterium]|nr:hypothetical protein [Candidatus Gottesmanbacteria bacterium]
MEDKLRALLVKIEASDLTDEQKEKMLAVLVDELEALVQPVLLRYVDPEKLETLASDTSKVTVESYLDLMKGALTNAEAYKELQSVMEQLLVEYESVMKEGGLL